MKAGGMSVKQIQQYLGLLYATQCFLGGSAVKNLPASAEDMGLIPGSGRFPGAGNGSPLQCSYLENPTDREAWRAAVYGVAKSWTELSD